MQGVEFRFESLRFFVCVNICIMFHLLAVNFDYTYEEGLIDY